MSSSEYGLVGCTVFSLLNFVMHRTSSATLRLMLFTLTIIVVFPFPVYEKAYSRSPLHPIYQPGFPKFYEFLYVFVS